MRALWVVCAAAALGGCLRAGFEQIPGDAAVGGDTDTSSGGDDLGAGDGALEDGGDASGDPSGDAAGDLDIALAVLSVPDHDFGLRVVGSVLAVVLTVSNDGLGPASGLGGAAPAAPFAYVGGSFPGSGGDCGATLAALSTCTVEVSFAPSTDGAITRPLTVGYDDGLAGVTASGDLTGTGLAASFAGWSDVRALGSEVPAPGSGLPPGPARAVTLQWNAMSTSPALTIDGYAIFRATSPGGQDFAAPLQTGLDASLRTFTDTAVQAATTYYYVVRPLVGVLAPPAFETDLEIAVAVPPDNMVLVHRWVANLEICGLMGRASDRAQDYRCAYVGPGGDGAGHFDLGSSLWVDAFESGCLHTPPPACGDAQNGCLGLGPPEAALGVDGDVFYNRAHGRCSIKSAGAWREANANDLSPAERRALASPAPGLPPVIELGQPPAWESCRARSVPGFGTLRLPSRKEQLAAMAWSDDLSAADITLLESGLALPSSGACNTALADGVVFDDLPYPDDPEALPWASSTSCVFGGVDTGCRALRTGSAYTGNCASRYGARDLIGNVWEWSSDTVLACDSAAHTCTLGRSAFDGANVDWEGFAFDGTIGPSGGGANLADWAIDSLAFGAARWNVPLGLPLVASAAASWDSLAIGAGAGELAAALFSADRAWINSDRPISTPGRGGAAGGSYSDGDGSGRFSLDLRSRVYTTFLDQGFRCVLPVTPTPSPVAGTAIFHGWSNVIAAGPTTPAVSSGLAARPATVTLRWHAIEVNPPATFTYDVFRATSPGAQNFSAPLASGVQTPRFADTSAGPGDTYYYVVRPRVAGTSVAASGVDTEIAVRVPPANMVLVHRWIANLDVCTRMQRAIDRGNAYRCVYSGRGDDGAGHFDLGEDLLIDAYETGCRFTPAPACGGAGCLGIGPPGGTVSGDRDDVYYDRASGTCSINTSPVTGTTWTDANAAALNAAQRRALASNEPGLPPLVWIDRARAADTCGAFTEAGFASPKRLPRRQESYLALGWGGFTDSTPGATEYGEDMLRFADCNTVFAAGIVFEDVARPSDLDTLPYTASASGRALRTGSEAARDCESRFGLRDHVGNVWEWNSDALTCETTGHTCVGVISPLDAGNTLWVGFDFDGAEGPGGTLAGQAPPDYTTEWMWQEELFGATRMLVPVGLPLVSGAAADAHDLGVGPLEVTPDELGADRVWIYSDLAKPSRAVISGGSFWDDGAAGRYALNLTLAPAEAYDSVGVRCVLPP